MQLFNAVGADICAESFPPADVAGIISRKQSVFNRFYKFIEHKSFMTSPAAINPATAGTKAMLAGGIFPFSAGCMQRGDKGGSVE